MSGTNGSTVPMPGCDIIAQAWYQDGISRIDFTDSANPVEIGCFDRGPIEPEVLVTGGFWSVYWYDGLICGTEIIRGLDVLKPVPSEYPARTRSRPPCWQTRVALSTRNSSYR